VSFLLSRTGVSLPWKRLALYFAYALGAAGAAAAASYAASSGGPIVLELAKRSAIFFIVVALCYWPARRRIRKILYG
jgi:hypothetical protein